MTEREWNLRRRIDELTDRLADAQTQLRRRKRPSRRCVWCGNRCYGHSCFAHDDLDALLDGET